MPKPEVVDRWLKENTRCYGPTQLVRLSNFEWPDPTRYGGAFKAVLSDEGTSERFDFLADGAGEIEIVPPLFHSPLGAPTTFIAIDTPEATYRAIERGIRHVVPRLKPFGIDPLTGAHLDVRSSLTSRLQRPLAEVRDRLLDEIYYVEVPVGGGRIQVAPHPSIASFG